MDAQQVIQGTWDEIAGRADELRQHTNLVLIVPSIVQSTAQLDQSDLRSVIDKLVREAEALTPEPPRPFGDVHESAFGDITVDKYRNQGLRL